MLGFFRCVAEAVAEKGVAGLVVEFVPGGQYVVDVAGSAWKKWRDRRQQQQLRDEVAEMAAATFEQVREAAKEVAREVAAGDPKLELDLELYLTQIPVTVRQSLKRPDDLTGTTVPADFMIRDEDDVAKLLPPRLPRFRPGDAPAFLRGWKLEELVGMGGFGEVWKVVNKRANNIVGAVKFAHALSDRDLSLLNDCDIVNHVMAAGRHPGIVALEDAWADGDDTPWLRFEYVAGGDLTGLIHTWQTLPPAERLTRVLAALRGLAETVGHFHRLDPAIVHRDLKPSNILVDAATGRLKVADFGIGAVSARRLLDGDRTGSMSRAGVLQSYLRGSHTPLYASPQQRAGSRDLDPRDDVHALGVIAYQMLTGRLDLGAGPDFADDLRDHGATEDLVTLLGRCVAQKPDRRPKDALELAASLAALDRAAEERPVTKPTVGAAAATPQVRTVPPPVRPAAVAKRPTAAMPKLPPGLACSSNQIVELRTLQGHAKPVNSVAFSPDGRVVATASDDRTAKLWDANTGRELCTLAGHTHFVYGVAFDPDGRVVATASWDDTARLWDAATGRELRTLTGHTSDLRGVAFSPDGRVLATASDDHTAKLWDANTGRELCTLTGHTHYVHGVAFSPDGRVLATVSADHTAKLWDAATGREVRTFIGHANTVNGVAFSPDGRVLATAGSDWTARLWDRTAQLWGTNTVRELRTLAGHQLAINGVAFGPDGRVIATASGDRTAKLWDTATGRQIATLAGHTDNVRSVAFSPGGRVLATAGHDKTIKLWLLLREGESADWSAGAVLQPPKPLVTVVCSGDGMVYPGDHIWARISVENGGRGDLVQVSVEVSSGAASIAGWQTALGRIKPGEKVERCLAALLPLDTPPGELRGELVFHEGNDFPIFARPLVFTIRPLPRPDFAVRWRVENDGSGLSQGSGDGQPKRGEYVDLAVTVENQTGEDFEWLFLTLRSKKLPNGTRITAERGDLGPVRDGETAEERVSFAVDPAGQPGPAAFELRVESTDGRTFAVETVEVVIR